MNIPVRYTKKINDMKTKNVINVEKIKPQHVELRQVIYGIKMPCLTKYVYYFSLLNLELLYLCIRYIMWNFYLFILIISLKQVIIEGGCHKKNSTKCLKEELVLL